jgi:hypothetical protein
VNGWLWLPPESDRFIIAPGQAGILSLNTAPSSSLTVSGSATVEELF